MAVAWPDKSAVRQKENYIWDDNFGGYRHSTFADRLCIPEENLPSQDFTLGCKVPDHSGPLAEGWEGNDQWKNSKIDSRQTKGVPNGEISENDFGKWTEFANCMKDVLSLIEGQAYRPETTEDIQIWGNGVLTYVDTNQKPMDREGNYNENDSILAGGMVSVKFYFKKFMKKLSFLGRRLG